MYAEKGTLAEDCIVRYLPAQAVIVRRVWCPSENSDVRKIGISKWVSLSRRKIKGYKNYY